MRIDMPYNGPPPDYIEPAITCQEARKIIEDSNYHSFNNIVKRVNRYIKKGISEGSVILNEKDLGDSVEMRERIIRHFQASHWEVTRCYDHLYQFRPID